jgi:HlyD family secretion protein
VIAVAAGAGAFLLESRTGKRVAQPEPVSAAAPSGTSAAVGCIGRVEPEGGVIVVAAAPVLGRTPVIARLLVKEGQMVVPGQIIAVLESLPDLESAVTQADAHVAVAQTRLAQSQAGARAGDVAALKSDLARLQMESNAAQQELERAEALARKDFVPRIQVDSARLKSQEAQGLLEAARHRLESLTEVRDSDLNLAKAELAATQADRERARVERSAGMIRSPAKGWIIQLMARVGEAVGPGGVVTLADTSRMNVVAEIYETDIARVHPGQKATVSSESLPSPIHGVVGWISPQIDTLNLPVDPSAPPEQRVYQARIQIDHPELLAHRINSKVNVLIEP